MKQRRLAAIMFTDLVGYTALMGKSEQKAFETLDANREIHERITAKHHGRIVKELGDGLLIVFENVTEAVLCSVDIQKEAQEKDVLLRIGIHEGEVVFENDDVFGDGVNIAARIQAEAVEGGICISDSVYRNIKNKIDIKAGSIGSRQLKNVEETIRLYQIKAEGVSIYHPVAKWKRSKVLVWLMIIAVSLASGIGGWFINEKANIESSANVERLNIVLPPDAPVIRKYDNLSIAISPDGTLIVYKSLFEDKAQLYKRYLNKYDAVPIPGTEGGQAPFFSPDGKWIGFQSNGILKKVLLSGGQPVEICEAPGFFSGTWLPDNTIVFNIDGEGLKRVLASGGVSSSVTTVDSDGGEFSHLFPHCLPDGNTILFSVTNGSGVLLYIKSIDLRNNEEKVIIKGGAYPMYSKSGHLIYVKITS